MNIEIIRLGMFYTFFFTSSAEHARESIKPHVGIIFESEYSIRQCASIRFTIIYIFLPLDVFFN